MKISTRKRSHLCGQWLINPWFAVFSSLSIDHPMTWIRGANEVEVFIALKQMPRRQCRLGRIIHTYVIHTTVNEPRQQTLRAQREKETQNET